MKTLEQTVRRISVGLATLATTALLVMVTAATLFCGVTAARAQEPDNRIDWRWGRPGVMVVTNAPTAVTVTNIATEVATEVASGVANTMFGPRVTALEGALGGNTNNWNTAYGWGDHAGLYREIGWVPSWGDLTDIPQDFPPSAHEHDYTAVTNPPWLTEYTETDEIALAALYGTNTILEAAITNEAALRTAHTNDTDNPHDVTAAQIGAITVEQDLAALRTYHYGSPDIVESPAEWFVFNGTGTIMAFNWEAGRENVVIPWAIGGVPVTAIGPDAFRDSGIVSVIAPQTVTSIGYYTFSICKLLTSVIAPQATSIENSAFSECSALTSVTIPQVTSIGNYAFYGCSSLTSIPLPQATSIGNSAFYNCSALTSIPLPQATSIRDGAFYNCSLLTAAHMGQNAPVQAADVFASIDPPPTVYVTDPQATGWGAMWNGVPVVRPPLYGSNVTAQAFTLGGDTITEWPSGGGETSIIAPLYESGTNITVTSTQSVYSVAVTGAGPVGIDWSGLALDGTGRAEITLRLNVAEWGGTNVTFSPALTFDRTPEILVTGVWEFAASTIDGVTTRVRQTWPECYGWSKLDSVYGVSANVGMMHDFAADRTNSITLTFMRETKMFIRYTIQIYTGAVTGLSVWMNYAQAGNTEFSEADIISSRVITPSVGYHTMMDVAETKVVSPRCVKLWIYPQGYAARMYSGTINYRPLNANERAAYEAGWRP